MEDEKPTKLYYSISEVSELSGVKPHILRFWEKDFSVLRPRKNRAGNRAYKERDLRTVLAIKQLLYEEKYTIKGARDRLLKDRSLLHGIEVDATPGGLDPSPTPDPGGFRDEVGQAGPSSPDPAKGGSIKGEGGIEGQADALLHVRRALEDVRSGLRDLLKLVGGPPGGAL